MVFKTPLCFGMCIPADDSERMKQISLNLGNPARKLSTLNTYGERKSLECGRAGWV